jgi:hypothetical protein
MKVRVLSFLLMAFFGATLAKGQGLQFYPLTPCRLADTRSVAPISFGTSLIQVARGSCGIPVGAQVVVGNLTSVSPTAGGWFTVYASDAVLPSTASSNYAVGEVTNNVFTVKLGADGAFKVFSTATTDAVIDVTGYYASPGAGGLYFHSLLSPLRLFDTRPQPACITPGASLAAGSTTTIPGAVTCGSVVIPATAKAVVGNATTVNPAGTGWLTLFPADAALPFTSNGNYTIGQVLNSQFYVGLSSAGEFKLFTKQSTHLVIDITGYFSPDATDVNGTGLLFTPIAPTRLLDTRVGGFVMACNTPGIPLTGGAENSQAARGTCSIAGTAQAIVGNATVVQPAGGGWLTMWPSDVSRPNTANSNYVTGQVFNRHFTTGLGSDGAFKIFSVATTNLVVDVTGYFAP